MKIKEITEIKIDTSQITEKLKEKFTTKQQLLFVESFSGFLNYDQTNDYVVNLDNVYKDIGFEQKTHCKRLLIKHFTIDVDYKIINTEIKNLGNKYEEKAALPNGRAAFPKNLGGAGQNKETILMNIKTFKKLCMKANTKNADEIHEYYITMENVLQEYIYEKIQKDEIEIREHAKSDLLIEQGKDKSVCYIGIVKVTQEYIIVKYGYTDDLTNTLKRHKKTYGEQFHFIYTIECDRNKELEDKIKNHQDLVPKHIRQYDGHQRHELIRVDHKDNNNIIGRFTVKDFIDVIKELKESMEINHNQELIRLNTELELIRETTKQKEIETKQKAQEYSYNIEMKKLELEMLKISKGINTITSSNNIQINKELKEILETLIEKNSESKLMLNVITNKLTENKTILFCKNDIINTTTKVFNTIYSNNRNYFTNIRLKNHSSFFPIQIYKDFIEQNIHIGDRNYYNGKILYKIKYYDVYNKFIEYTKDTCKLLKENEKIFNREFNEFILKFTNAKISNDVLFNGQKTKAFIGIVFRIPLI